MNGWDAIERIINTLPQWDVIKWIMGIQEELKCAKEDNLYQLRQNKNLQSKIDKAIEYINKHCVNEKISKEVGYKCYTMADTNELEKIMNILGDDK